MVSDAVAPWAEPVLHTAEDLLRMPDDAWRYELVQGRLVRMPPAGLEHGAISVDLATAIRTFVHEQRLGRVFGAETGFLVSAPDDPDTVLAPDLAFIAASRVPRHGTRDWVGFARLAPDLVVEIASPSQSRRAVSAKARQWLDAGVRIVWVVRPSSRQVDVWEQDRNPEVRTIQGEEQLVGGNVLPGFSYDLTQLWQ